MLFFCSSRRRHTRCALVTGVQTCALPIFISVGGRVVCDDVVKGGGLAHVVGKRRTFLLCALHREPLIASSAISIKLGIVIGAECAIDAAVRSDERRVGKECVSTCRFRWSPSH